jgi:FeS assembly SUF system protein
METTDNTAPNLSHSAEPWNDHGTGEEMQTGLVARAGGLKDQDDPVPVSREGIIEALKTVFDPEIPVNIYELGLIYDLEINEVTAGAKITMTLTAPGCPVAGVLPQQVADAVAGVPGTGPVEVYLVWEPAWDMTKMSEEAKLALGMF